MISDEELREILEYYKAGYKNEYAHKDIEKLIYEIYRLKGLHYSAEERIKKVKKIKKV
jgi:hypothetical protein